MRCEYCWVRSLFSFVAASAVASLLALAGVQSASAEPAPAVEVCVGDTCDNGAWAAARGELNDVSYWGMDPGHNCTNYVAWRLVMNDVKRPFTNPGNASTWASRAAFDGYPVDHLPAVGAIAQWDGLAGGYASEGHVAYVEAINDDGTIVVSEDYWHGGDQLGPLTFRTVNPADVSNFIHYVDSTNWLRQAFATAGVWANKATGLDPDPTVISAVTIGDDLKVYFAENGKLEVASQGAGGWEIAETGVATVGTSLTAVNMGRDWPYLVSVENGQLVVMVQTSAGWQLMRSGITLTGEISAVNLGGLFPTVYLSQEGVLYEIWADADGWHQNSTGIPVWGPVTAVTNAAGWPEVFTVESGSIFRSWADSDGWHKENTGILSEGKISATLVGGEVTLILLHDGELFQIDRDDTGLWVKTTTGLRGGRLLTVIDGEDAPLVLQVG